MTDTWAAPATSFDKPSYVVGQTMTLTITGVSDSESVTTALPAATMSVTFTAADGATNTITFPVPPISQTIVSSPAITAPATITDSSGRVWTLHSAAPAYVYTATA